MNKEECELCIKYKTMYCPNSSECYMTQDKPYYQNRIMLLEENQQLKEKVNQLEANRDRAINYIKWNATSNYFDEEKNMFRREIDLLEILERGKE